MSGGESGAHGTGRRRELYAGGLMIAIGAFATARGLSYHVGTLTAMGAGFFPVALGVILMLTGLAIAVTAGASAARGAWRGVDWRGGVCIVLSLIGFVVLGRHGGLLPATFAVVFIGALGDRGNSLRDALALAVCLTALCVAVFWYALQLQLPLLEWD